MGQKVHPRGFRLGIIEDWDSTWYSKSEYSKNLKEDLKLRKQLKHNLYRAGISKIKINEIAKKET